MTVCFMLFHATCKNRARNKINRKLMLICVGPFPSFAFMSKEVFSIVFFKLFIKIKILLL